MLLTIQIVFRSIRFNATTSTHGTIAYNNDKDAKNSPCVTKVNKDMVDLNNFTIVNYANIIKFEMSNEINAASVIISITC